MSVYLGIYGTLAMLGLTVTRRTDQYIFLALLWVFLVWFMGWRYETGCDFGGYLHRYTFALSGEFNLLEVLSKPEPAFQFITLGLRAIGAEYFWINAISSIIIVTCFLIFCGYFRDSLMLGALLFPVMIVQLSMSGLRQGLACGFIMLAAIALQRCRPLMVAGLVVLAAQFHSSAIIFLPMAALAFRRASYKTMLACAAIAAPAAIQLLGDRVEVYQDRYFDDLYGEIESRGAYVRYILIAIPTLMFLAGQKRMKRAFPQYYRLFSFTAITALAILPIGLVNTVVLHRLIYYIMPLTILLFVYQTWLLSIVNRTLEYRLLPIAIYGAYSLSWFVLSSHATLCYIPYKNFIFL